MNELTGKIPPQSVDLEETVNGILLVAPEAINDIIHLLTPEMFYKASNQVIYSAIIDTFRKYNTCDLVTVTNHLRDTGKLNDVGGVMYITELTCKIVSSANIETYAIVIKQNYLLRQYIKESHEIISLAYEGDLDATIEKAETGLLRIAELIHRKEPIKLITLVDEVISNIQKIQNREISLIGVPSGFITMDRAIGGFKKGELTIIAARPSVGKTALALQVARNAAELNNGVAFFSCEMSDMALAQRALSGESDKTNVELMTGKCNIDTIIKQSEGLINLPLYIDDTSNISCMEIRAKARKLILRYGVKMVVVDYLQLMKGEGQSREQEVSSISRGLKSIAKDLDIPVIALSQINRKSEDRADKRPQLSDLRESGAIEQDADMVIFIYRPSMYGVKTVDIAGGCVNSDGLMELILAKNRNGMTGSFYMKHNTALTKIEEYNNETPY